MSFLREDFLVRWEKLLVVFLLLFAAIVRVPVMIRNPVPAGDGIASNLEVAANLHCGSGFSTMRKWTLYDESLADIRPEGNRQPAMAILLFLVYLVTGPGFTSAQLLSMVIGLACLVICWLWARRMFGRIPALFTLLLLTITPLFIWYSTQPDSLMLFTAFFFTILTVADSQNLSFGRVILLGLLTALSYLVRTQGLLLAVSMGGWILYRSREKKLPKALLFSAVFVICCLPWFVRNVRDFGSPLYTQGGQFLLNENHWAAWEVRDTAPEPLDMLKYQGPLAVSAYIAKGILRVLEPVTTGSLHRGEVFGQPTLIAFALLAILLLRDSKMRRKMILPAVAALPSLMLLTLHEHSGRYLAFFIVIVTAMGSAGLVSLGRLTGRRTAVIVSVLMLVPFIYPLSRVLEEDSTARAAEATEVSQWIKSNVDESQWVVTYPNVELMIWDYRRPTLTMPNDYQMLLWPCLQEHGVRYVVVDGYLPSMRPRLADRWRRTIDGSAWQVEDPPPFLHEVYRSSTGFTIVYEMSGGVPEGYMEVDSLPRDNMRALPPSSSPW